jgi:hypothetical protein
MYWWFNFKLRESGHAREQLHSIDAYKSKKFYFIFLCYQEFGTSRGQREKPSINTVCIELSNCLVSVVISF